MNIMPRNIALEFIYKNQGLITGQNIEILFTLFNSSVGIFRMIINDLEKVKLVELKGYPKNNLDDNLTYLPEYYKQLQIKLTRSGLEYVEIKIIGTKKPFNFGNSPADCIQLANVGININSPINQFSSFDEFSIRFKGTMKMNLSVAYYLLTGKKDYNERKTIFISYSWEPDEVKKWVLELANKLEGKYNVILDQKSFLPGDNLERRMIESIVKSDYVLLILTPQYKAKAEKSVGGVGFEASIIDAELDKYVVGRKYIPLIRIGDRHTSIPSFVNKTLPVEGQKGKFRMQKLIEAFGD